MAAPKPKGKTPPKMTLAAKKTARAQKAGYTGKTAGKAQGSVTKQYGLVKNAAGAWVKPDAAFLERQMVANGWGVGQTGVTPVNIGGERWLTGQGQLTYTGERSDAAKRKPGKPYSGGTAEGDGVSAAAVGSTTAPGLGGKAAPWENADLAGGGIPLTAEDLAAGAATGAKKKKKPAKRKPAKRKNPRGQRSQGGKPSTRRPNARKGK